VVEAAILLVSRRSVVIAAMQTTMIRASMTAYSTAVGPAASPGDRLDDVARRQDQVEVITRQLTLLGSPSRDRHGEPSSVSCRVNQWRVSGGPPPGSNGGGRPFPMSRHHLGQSRHGNGACTGAICGGRLVSTGVCGPNDSLQDKPCAEKPSAQNSRNWARLKSLALV